MLRKGYRLTDESGAVLAIIYRPVDMAHVYQVFGPGHEISSKNGKVLYPLDEDNPGLDSVTYIAARLMDRLSRATRDRGPVDRPRGDREPRVKRYEVGPSWKDQKRETYRRTHAKTGE